MVTFSFAEQLQPHRYHIGRLLFRAELRESIFISIKKLCYQIVDILWTSMVWFQHWIICTIILDALKIHTKLETIDLSYSNYDTMVYINLACQVGRSFPELQHIPLNSTDIDDDGLNALSTMILHKRKLYLCINSCAILLQWYSRNSRTYNASFVSSI